MAIFKIHKKCANSDNYCQQQELYTLRAVFVKLTSLIVRITGNKIKTTLPVIMKTFLVSASDIVAFGLDIEITS